MQNCDSDSILEKNRDFDLDLKKSLQQQQQQHTEARCVVAG